MRLTFVRTADYDLIRQTITHPKTYRFQCDEKSPEPENFRPPDNVLYVAVYAEAEYLGLFCLVPYNTDTWEIHTCLLPGAWGYALEIYRAGIRWVWGNTDRSRILGRIAEQNRLALAVARRAGLRPVTSDESPKTHYKVELEIRRGWAALHKA